MVVLNQRTHSQMSASSIVVQHSFNILCICGIADPLTVQMSNKTNEPIKMCVHWVKWIPKLQLNFSCLLNIFYQISLSWKKITNKQLLKHITSNRNTDPHTKKNNIVCNIYGCNCVHQEVEWFLCEPTTRAANTHRKNRHEKRQRFSIFHFSRYLAKRIN